MNWVVPEAAGELSAPAFQLLVTIGLALLCFALFLRFRKPYFGWFATAWALYCLRLLAILSFLVTTDPIWLFWHQVTTGWTALALLWAALVFSLATPWRPRYAALLLFPLVWSYVAIYRLDNFLWAAGPAVLFLSGATLWTGLAFLKHHRKVDSPAAVLLATSFFLWAGHHLDYPFLRAQGVWNPWGYYLDVLLELAVGLGILVLVQEDLRRGLGTLAALSGDLQRASSGTDLMKELVRRPLQLPAVRGAGLFLGDAASGACDCGSGICSDWEESGPPAPVSRLVAEVLASGEPRVARSGAASNGVDGEAPPFMAVLPVTAGGTVRGALVVVSDARDPFTALDDRFLTALGQQLGAALENGELYRALRSRSAALERLTASTLRSQEEERERISRELHDETAQVFAALSMELGTLAEAVGPPHSEQVQVAAALVRQGVRSIRSVTEQLRPPLLDDLGLVPALAALVDQFNGTGGIRIEALLPRESVTLAPEAELALFRALQEALSNVARHSKAKTAVVRLTASPDVVRLRVQDDGIGSRSQGDGNGGTGLLKMRERLAAAGGELRLARSEDGTELVATIPMRHA